MKEIMDVLMDRSQVGYLATVEEGRPRLCPWDYIFEDSGRFYFCTDSDNEAYRQLRETPYMEYSKTTDAMVWVRLRGGVVFEEDPQVKALCMERFPQLRELSDAPELRELKVFYMAHGEATISDLTCRPPRIFHVNLE